MTVTWLTALLTELNTLTPGPLCWVHVPVPTLATPVKVYGLPTPIPQTLPPTPALAVGVATLVTVPKVVAPGPGKTNPFTSGGTAETPDKAVNVRSAVGGAPANALT